MSEMMKRFLKEEDGATMVEYVLMVAFIALVCVGAVGALGIAVSGGFGPVTAALN